MALENRIIYFDGDHINTVVTSDPFIVSQWLRQVESLHNSRLHRLIVGLDIEWRPNVNRFTINPVATLQLCIGTRCLIVQLLYCSHISYELFNFLNNANYTFAGVGIRADVDKLTEDYGFRFSGHVVDLRELAADIRGDMSLKTAGLKTLSYTVLGKELDKPDYVTRSAWDNQYLDFEQVRYACLDAFMSFKIGKSLYDDY